MPWQKAAEYMKGCVVLDLSNFSNTRFLLIIVDSFNSTECHFFENNIDLISFISQLDKDYIVFELENISGYFKSGRAFI